jgi:LPXTG-site transpeptidase (sortase) family protein
MARKELSLLTKILLFIYDNSYIVFGIFFILVFLGWRYHNLRVLSFDTNEVNIEVKSLIKPVYIKAYPVGVDVSIKDAKIIDGIWQIHPNSVSYLVTSDGIGGKSNIILYGHNKIDVLGPIRHAKIDSLIELTGSDGNRYKYKVVKTEIVKPSNLSYLGNTEDETLTIYTCIGLFDSERFILVAKRVI